MAKRVGLFVLKFIVIWCCVVGSYLGLNALETKEAKAADDSMSWCVTINVTWREGTETGKVCTKTKLLCQEVERVAKDFKGTDSGINKVGNCKD